jgi:hypothetical protein
MFKKEEVGSVISRSLHLLGSLLKHIAKDYCKVFWRSSNNMVVSE